MKTSIIFLFLFVTPIIGSGKGSSSKRGRFKPDHYLDEESSETETEQSHIGGTSSTDPNVYGGTQTLNLETVTIQEQENPQQILPNNIVAMKKIPYEKANSNKSKAYRYKWIEEVEEGLNNYHLAEGIKDKMIYIGCDRCRRYFYFEAKVNFMPHNKSHKN
uniref:Uncharacterized protein n=1 Tax=Meloidogyne enterolobii TaxID=390850 RepID=A0A6V7YBD5_MELEN|nr:unnamed protein product [Meloidogyne enterolobii]